MSSEMENSDLNFLQRWARDNLLNNHTEIDPSTGERRATFKGGNSARLFGLDPNKEVQSQSTNLNNKAGRDYLKTTAYTADELGLGDNYSKSDVNSAIRNFQTRESDTRRAEEFERGLEPVRMQLEASEKNNERRHEQSQTNANNLLQQNLEQMRSSERQAESRIKAQLEEGKSSRAQALDFRMMDKGDNAEQRATALEIEQMRGAREDKRLKMQHDRYYADKKSSSMQALVAGLAALGAAFAV